MKINLGKVKETAKGLLGKVTQRAAGVRVLVAGVGKACAGAAEKAGPLRARLPQVFASIRMPAALVPAENKRLMVFVVGGLSALLLLLIITAVALNTRRPGAAAPDMRAVHLIPPEELFIPDEPDFVPDFLLEREPRHFWSIDDIRPYWRSPGNPEFWHNVIRTAVDELMENIP